jgi:hypothetical protein
MNKLYRVDYIILDDYGNKTTLWNIFTFKPMTKLDHIKSTLCRILHLDSDKVIILGYYEIFPIKV